MPLIPGKSKKAFKENVRTEMDSGKPQPQSLAISYSVRRKPTKKASGGTVESGSKDMNMAEGGAISANNERRPMPENTYDDAKSVSRNSAKAAPRHGDRVLEDTSGPAHNNKKTQPIKHPKMVPQSAYSVRMRDEEDHLMESEAPGPYGAQPRADRNEEGANRQGPKVRDMASQHNNNRPPYAKGGPVEDTEEARIRRAQLDHQDMDSPSEDEGSQLARSLNEEGPDRQGPSVSDMEDEHSTGRKPYADGGDVSSSDEDDEKTTEQKRKEVSDSFKKALGFADGGSIQFQDAEHPADEDDHNPATSRQIYADEMDDQPSEEEEIARQSSLAAAVMAKMKKYAKGGEITETRDHDDILSHDSIESHPEASQVDLRRNAEEDANEEDQLSFNALQKENYSESAGLDALNQPTDSNLHGDPEERDAEDHHDKSAVSKILAKMRKRSPIQEGGNGR